MILPRFGKDGQPWLAPALGESWAHQASAQLRLERMSGAQLDLRLFFSA